MNALIGKDKVAVNGSEVRNDNFGENLEYVQIS